MDSIRSSIGDRDRGYREIVTGVLGLLAIGFALVERGAISRVVIGVGVPVGFVVASGDRIGSPLGLGWFAVPVQVATTASTPSQLRI